MNKFAYHDFIFTVRCKEIGCSNLESANKSLSELKDKIKEDFENSGYTVEVTCMREYHKSEQ